MRTALSFLTCFLLFVFTTLTVNANPTVVRTIRGKVLDANTHKPVPYANVAVEGTSIGAVTNFEGEFLIERVPVGKHHVVATCIGYQTSKKPLSVSVERNGELTFEIAEDFIGLDQVVVTADRNAVTRKDAPVVVNSISTKLLEQTSSATLADGLCFTPGLRVENDCNNCGFSQVRMNGLEGPYTQILINSRPIFSGLASVYGLEHIPSSLIQRIEVVRGGGSALFGGNAIAGTINIITKDPVRNSFKAGVKYGSVGVGADGADSPAGDMTADFNASVVSEDRKSGLFLFGMKRNRDEWDANKDNFSDLVKIENLSAGFRAYHRFGELSKLTLEYHAVDEYRRGGDQLDLHAHEAEVAEEVEHKIQSGGLVWDQFFNETRNSKLSFYASGQTIDRKSYYGARKDDGTPDYGAYGNTDDLAVSAGVQFFTKMDNFLIAPADITLGVEDVYNELEDNKLGYYDAASKKNIPTTVIADQSSNTIGAFAQSKWDLGFASFLLGVRMDSYEIENSVDNSSYSNTVFSPRANVLFDLSQAIQLRLSYARGFRAPQIFDEDLHIEASQARRVIHKNNPNLKEEKSNSYTASLDFTKSFGQVQTYFLVEGFYTRLYDPFVNEYSDEDGDGNLVSLRQNGDDATVTGMNVEFKIAPSPKVDFQMGMTLQTSEYEKTADWGEDDDASNSSTDKILRTPNRYGYFAMNWKPVHEFTATFNGSYTGPMHLIHLPGGNDKFGNEIKTESLVKTDDFMDFGINLAYHIDLSGDVKMEFDLGMKNIFNSFQDDFDRGPARDAGWVYGPLNPRTIYFGVKIGNIF
jgi:outer membrane receptor for ferrienterochelin and colicins